MANNWNASPEFRRQRATDVAPKGESTPLSWDLAASLDQLTTDPRFPYHPNTYHMANVQSHNNLPTTLYTDMAQVHLPNYPWNGAPQNWPMHQVSATDTGPFRAEEFGMMTTQDYHTIPFTGFSTMTSENLLSRYYSDLMSLCQLIAAMPVPSSQGLLEHSNMVSTPTTSQETSNNEDHVAVASLPYLGTQVQQDQAFSPGGSIFLGPHSLPVASPVNGEDVPQNVPRSPQNLRNSTFLAVFTCEGRVGIRLSLATQGLLHELDSGQDQSVFQDVDFGTKVYYKLFWPGYKPFEHAQYAKSKKKGYITRVKIVQHVAKITAKFISDNENFLSEDAKWRVGNNGIKLENLELIGLKRYLKAGVVPVFRYRSA